MLILSQMMAALGQLSAVMSRRTEVKIVIGTRDANGGLFDGQEVMTVVPVAGMVVNSSGVYLFVEQNKTAHREEPLPKIPVEFNTGNALLDARRKNAASAPVVEDWKKGLGHG